MDGSQGHAAAHPVDPAGRGAGCVPAPEAQDRGGGKQIEARSFLKLTITHCHFDHAFDFGGDPLCLPIVVISRAAHLPCHPSSY